MLTQHPFVLYQSGSKLYENPKTDAFNAISATNPFDNLNTLSILPIKDLWPENSFSKLHQNRIAIAI